MNKQVHNLNRGKIVCVDQNEEIKSLACLENLFQTFGCLSVPIFEIFVEIILLLLEKSSFERLCPINCVDRNF